MEFLMIILLYLLVGMLCLVAYQHADSSFLTQGPIGRVRLILASALHFLSRLIPYTIKHDIGLVVDYIFFTRNYLFQLLYLLLLGAGHVVMVMDIFPQLYAAHYDVNHTLIPMVLLLTNVIFFAVCSLSDAGEITPATIDRYSGVFPADGVMYTAGSKCRTCGLLKPARSKHCAFYNKCIYKFDHYCAWTNNCVGGLNHRYFIGYLVTICAMCINGVVMATDALVVITMRYQLMTLRYMDEHGNPQPMNFRVLVQTLFMQYPRLVFFVAALTVTATVMVGFTGYHGYQILSNQTTNERYKKYYLKKANKDIPPNIYNRGIFNNVLEEFFPYWHIDRVKNNKRSEVHNGWQQSYHHQNVGRNKKEVNGWKKRK